MVAGWKLCRRKPSAHPARPIDESGDEELAVRRGDDEDRSRGDRGDARRQPVHVVEQVERVRDADHPHDGHDRVRHVRDRRGRLPHRCPTPRAPRPPPRAIARPGLSPRRSSSSPTTASRIARPRTTNSSSRPDTGGRTIAATPTVKRERADDREPAQIGHRVGVALVLAGMVVHVAPQREPQHQRREEQRQALTTRGTRRGTASLPRSRRATVPADASAIAGSARARRVVRACERSVTNGLPCGRTHHPTAARGRSRAR